MHRVGRLIIGAIAPPILAGTIAAYSLALMEKGPSCTGMPSCGSVGSSIFLLALVFGIVPSIYYSAIMEFGAREVLGEPKGGAWYILISTFLGGVAGSVLYIPPLIIIGALVGFFMGLLLMRL